MSGESIEEVVREIESAGGRREERKVDDGKMHADTTTQRLEVFACEGDRLTAYGRDRQDMGTDGEHEVQSLDFLVSSTGYQGGFRLGERATGIGLRQAHWARIV